MIGKIAQAIKAAISPAKPPRPAVEYYDQGLMRIMHSGLEEKSEQQVDSWANGRYRTNTWFVKK
jgi:hypothetical protein